MTVTIVGVRHHSPACAEVVKHVIDTVRPRFVLIEGPTSMNGRLGEIGLGHTPPVALFSFAIREGSRSASFYPFAAYSPEWVALERARAHDIPARFIDLPADHPAFGERENHYSDEDLLRSRRFTELTTRLGFENVDAMWDHLFEQPADPAALRTRLHAYFDELRADETATRGDEHRERFMAQSIAWTQAQAPGAPIVVVCGGYHARALAALVPTMPNTEPDPNAFGADDRGEVVREGIYLVPFSFRRLDAFRGYASGMPSPAFYQAVWEHGPAGGAQRMFERAIKTLRARKLRVSPADAIAASTMIEALRRLRDHACALRTDVLDGMATALLEDALDVPLPWSRRGPLSSRTHPMLALVVEAFTGEQRGKLAPDTPRPPLVDDARAELLRVGIVATAHGSDHEARLDDPVGRERSAVLHRLRILDIPGITLVSGRRFSRHDAQLAERWRVAAGTAFDPALIEAALWGATLVDAARAALEDRANAAAGAVALANVLFEAALAGLGALSQRTLERLREGLLVEADLEVLGRALAKLVLLAQDPNGGIDPRALDDVLHIAFDRAGWLLEGITGESAPPVRGHIDAVIALRDTLVWLGARLGIDAGTTGGLAHRRAHDPEAPPYLRGACLGLLAALGPELASAGIAPLDELALTQAVRAAAPPARLGELLIGLFALAREPLREGDALLGAIDRTLADLPAEAFMHALPSLRQAFGYFPPRERFAIAERVVVRSGSGDARAIVATLDPVSVASGLARDQAAAAAFLHFGLEDS